MASGRLSQTVDWSRLKDAHGYAGGIPSLLNRLRRQTGSAFEETLGELCSRIWYNGAIFAATAPAVGELCALLDRSVHPQKHYLYEVLAAVTESSREAALAPPERPCAAGSYADGLAVLRNILAERRHFRRDLDDPRSQVRRLAARLLVAPDDIDSAAEIKTLFSASTDSRVRGELLAGLLRMADHIPDWPAFVDATLQTELDPEGRFLLRCAELAALRNAVSDPGLTDLVKMFVAANHTPDRNFTDTCGDPDQFVQAIGVLSLDRQSRALCMAINGTTDANLSVLLAERLLRLVFYDRRKNWGDASFQLVNRDGTEAHYEGIFLTIFKALIKLWFWPWLPFLRNRWPRPKNHGLMPFIAYSGLEGQPPEFHAWLTPQQQLAVVSIARHDPLWQVSTNLWELFALPSNRQEMEEYGVAGE